MMKAFLPLLLSLPLLLASCHKEEAQTPLPEETKGRRTVLVYMVAENSLGRNDFHKNDSAEIMAGREYIKSTDRMLVFRDAGGKPTLYRVRADRNDTEVIKQWDEDFCSASPARLQEVLEEVKGRFPSDEYGLVMWSHADGWIAPTDTAYTHYEESAQKVKSTFSPLSFGIDSGSTGNMGNNGAQMSVEGMASAIQAAGIHLKYIFFDACLMQNVEVGYALRQIADYLVAAPIATPGPGAYYTHELKEGLFSDAPADIARTYFADVQSEELQSEYQGYGLAISCIRPAALQQLADVLREALPYSRLAGRTSVSMDSVLYYQAYLSNFYYRPHNYDALQALRRILPATYFEQARAALQAAITYRGATESYYLYTSGWNEHFQTIPVASGDYCAVSMFIPQSVYTENAARTKHGDLNAQFRETEWYKAAGFATTGW